MQEQGTDDIVVVRPQSDVMTKQQLPNFVGISGATTGSQILSMNLVIIPAGGRAKAHVHVGYETAIYVVQGNIETHYGDRLAKSVVNAPGDFIFIPPGVPHQPVNLSADTPAIAVVARSDPNEQERTVLYEVAEDGDV